MNKKVNTLLFIFGATAFNILIAILCFIVLTSLYYNFLMPLLPEGGRSWGFAIIFLASIVLSFVIYRVIMKYLMKKIDMEKYFDPLFARKNFKRN
ncbi:MAG: leader peptide processing enzyme [Treponema sp.]|nr:leader peptide processing enzyme [Treponema sp.]